MSADHAFVSADYLRRAAQRLHDIKALSHARLELRPGQRVLDLGCGPGIDTVALADLVGEDGQVVGIDSDLGMLAEADLLAKERGLAARVEHCLGDAAALAFADGYFDACRAERLIQVLPPAMAAQVVAESARVVRPGGRIVLVDTDWGTASVDFPDVDLERRLMRFFADRLRPNGYAGRLLFTLLAGAGLADAAVEACPLVLHRLEDTPFGGWLCEQARAAGLVDAAEAERWQRVLAEKEAEGSFFAQVVMNVATACKPG